MRQHSFKHSGTLGDLIYSLPLVKYFGGGNFYLHLNQIDYLSKHIYGVNPPAVHAGRMNLKDYEFMKSFMQAQPYIDRFELLDPRSTEITHNLDRFRSKFAAHPGNYVDCYAGTFGIEDPAIHTQLRQTPWIAVPSSRDLGERNIVINRTDRWIPGELSNIWKDWQSQGVDQRSIFIGLEHEYELFRNNIGWAVPHVQVNSLLEMAELIKSSQVFIGNQSAALSLAIGMGHPDIWCEARRDLPMERNECYFPMQLGLHYF